MKYFSVFLILLFCMFLDSLFGCQSDSYILALDPLVVGSIISGAGSLIGDLFGFGSSQSANKTQIQLQRENNQFNAEQAGIQRQWSEDMYNKYQSPTAQVSQLRQAGLNPALVFGQGQVGSFDGYAASAGSAPSMHAAGFSGLSAASQQIGSMVAASKQASANLRKTELEADAVGIDNKYKSLHHEAELLESLARTKKGTTEYKMLVEQYQRERRLSALRDAKEVTEHYRQQKELNLLDEQLAMAQLQRELAVKSDERSAAQAVQAIAESRQRIKSMIEQDKLTRKNVEKVVGDLAEQVERTEGLRLDNKQRAALVDDIIEEAQGEHKLWKYNNEIDQELLPADAFVGRIGRYLFGTKKIPLVK